MSREITELEARKIAKLVVDIATCAHEMMRKMVLQGEPLTEEELITTLGTHLAFQVMRRYSVPADFIILDICTPLETQGVAVGVGSHIPK